MGYVASPSQMMPRSSRARTGEGPGRSSPSSIHPYPRTEFVANYNAEHPHRSLLLEPPVPRAPATCGPVGAWSVIGGLHHVYRRAA